MDIRPHSQPEGTPDAMRTVTPRKPPLAVLILITAISAFALQIIVPAMPGLAHEFNTSFGVAQMSLSAYLVGMTVGQLLYGPLSDRFGRRPVLLGGLAIFMAGSLCCVFAWDIEPLIFGRLLQAFGSSAGMVLSRAIVRDLYDRERAAQMLAYITAAMVLAPMISPIIGGHLYEWFGWHAVFWFVIGVGIAVTAASFIWLHETHFDRGVTATMGELWQGFGYLIRLRRFRGYAFQVAFTTAAFYSFLGGASPVAINVYGITAAGYGWWFILISGGYMTGNFISGRIGQRVGSDHMITVGTVLSMLGCLVLLGVYLAGGLNVAGFFLISGVVGIGNGFSMPNGFAGAVSVDPSRAGTASGLSGALQMGLGATLMTVVGYTFSDSPLPVIAMMLTGSVFAWLAHLHGMRKPG
jgi:DHA1 family bicyclomycin/chloramphenicol resistance-like MFS transporter